MDQLGTPPTAPRFRTWQRGLFAALVLLGLAFAVVQWVVVARWKAYKVASNSMAPTILGWHVTGVCAECGQPAYCSALELGYPHSEGTLMICNTFHMTRVPEFDATVHGPDRVLVDRQAVPQRWDLVVYRAPEDPATDYVHRLVGLPGETVVIENGELHINGEQVAFPPSLKGLGYVTDDPTFVFSTVWGTPANPAVLGDGEYFVLGDFSRQARDSRLWETGAPRHPPYAVPAHSIIGVASSIYWPPSRIGSLRVSPDR